MGSRRFEIRSVGEFIDRVETDYSHTRERFMFRGQADNREYRLLPSAHRYRYRSTYVAMYNEWCRQAVATRALPEDFLQRLALAQHYGLPTKFLDWSLNPLVALFFAVEDEKNEYGSNVYVLNRGTVLALVSTNDNDLDPQELYGCTPPSFDPRMHNQASLFTYHPSDRKAARSDEPWVLPPDRYDILHVSCEDKGGVKDSLRTLGIHEGFIYPDLGGLAKQMVAKHATPAGDHNTHLQGV